MLPACVSCLEPEEIQALLHFTDKETVAQRGEETSLRYSGSERVRRSPVYQPPAHAPCPLHVPTHLDLPW